MIAYSGTENMPPHTASKVRSSSIRPPCHDPSTAPAEAMVPAPAAADAKSQQNAEMPSAAKGTSRGETSPCSMRAQAIEPMPTPTAKTVSNRVRTEPSPCRVSRAIIGNSVIRVAPMVQNQDRPSKDSQIGRIAAAWRRMPVVSARMLARIGKDGSAAWQGGMRLAANRPSNDKATPTAPTIAPPSCPSISAPPATVPTTMARNVVASIIPFPATSSASGSNSGSTPYFTGPNSAACTPRPTSTASSAGMLPHRKAAAAAAISAISAAL